MNKEDIIKEETVGIITSRLALAREHVKEWKVKINHRRALYNGAHYSKEDAKPNEEQYPDPTPTNTVDLAVGILMSNDMVFKATPWEPDPILENSASNVEKLLNGILEINNEREEVHIPYEVALQFCRDGMGCLYSVWDPTIHKTSKKNDMVEVIDTDLKEGVKKYSGFTEPPVQVKVIDPIEMSMLPGGSKRWLHVFHESQMTVYEVEKRFGVRIARFDGMTEDAKMTTKEAMIDYWRYATISEGTEDKEVTMNSVLFANEFIPGFEPRVMEGYDDIPYLFGFFKPVDRNTPSNWGHSMLDPQESSVRFLESAVNRRMRSITTFSSLPMVIKTRPGRQLQIDPGLESPVVIDIEEDVGFPVWPGSPPDVDKHIELLRSRIQQSGFADVMFGAGPGAMTGYALSQLGDQNRIRMEQPIGHLELFWSMWARRVVALTAYFAKDNYIRVYGNLNREYFAAHVNGGEMGQFQVNCQIIADFPNDQTRKSAMATQAAPFLSKKTITERYYNVHQPDDERDQQLIEMAEEHPIMRMFGIIRALQKYTKAEDPELAEAATMTMQALKTQMQPNPNQQQKTGSAPGNALGTQSASGEAIPQAMGQPAPGQEPEAEIENMANAAPGLMGGIGGGMM
jgi:hypothetical protein